MANYYSGTVDEIKIVCKEIGVGSSLTDTISPAQFEQYQKEADGIIDAQLGVVYEVPLVQIKRGTLTYYPNVIAYIARRIAASDLILNEMSQIEPNVSQSATNKRTRAMAELSELVQGAIIGSRYLEGQKPRARNHFIRPGVAPASAPTTPPTGMGT